MLTAMLAVKNVMGNSFDIWAVNSDQEYHEELRGEEASALRERKALESTQPQVPHRIEQQTNLEEAPINSALAPKPEQPSGSRPRAEP